MFNLIIIFTSFRVQDDSELPAKTGHHSVVTDTSEELETVKIDEASAKALGSDEFTRYHCFRLVSVNDNVLICVDHFFKLCSFSRLEWERG